MSAHVWESKTFTARTLANGVDAWRFAIAHTNNPLKCLPLLAKFAGYWLEECRQRGHKRIGFFWDCCNRSNHAYSRGKNATSYEKVGRRILAWHVNMTDDALLEAMWDKAQEMGLVPGHTL